MTRIFGFNVLPEMLGLWLIETGICFFVFLGLLHGAPLGGAEGLANLSFIDALLLALTVGLVGFATGLYRPETCFATRRLLLQAAVSAAVSLPAVWLVARAFGIDVAGLFGDAASWPAVMLLAWTGLLLATRFLFMAALRLDLFVRRVAVLGASAQAARTVAAIAGMRRGLFRVEAVQTSLPAGAPAAALLRGGLPHRLWGVVLAGPPAAAAASLPQGLRRFDAAAFWEHQLGRIDIDAAPPTVQAAAVRPGAAWLRRGMDVGLAAALLLLTAPLLLLTALLVRLESPGPVLYRQSRVGEGGHPFTLWKFRSMRADAERLGPIWAALGDSRVTRVGRLIRKLRIDELPQLVNILRGDMSLVGPRPERPHFVDQLSAAIPLYGERARVKPGLTGWAQVNYPYGASVEDARAKLSYDLYYVKHRTLLFDLLILCATVRVILFQEGAR